MPPDDADDVTDPDREDHDYENDSPNHSQDDIEDPEASSKAAVWIILLIVAVVLILVAYIGLRVYKSRK